MKIATMLTKLATSSTALLLALNGLFLELTCLAANSETLRRSANSLPVVNVRFAQAESNSKGAPNPARPNIKKPPAGARDLGPAFACPPGSKRNAAGDCRPIR
jgi:hypothetical protein